MTDIQIEGVEDQGAGGAYGRQDSPDEPPAKGRKISSRQVEGKIRQTAGKLEAAIGVGADQATAAVTRLSDRAAVTASALADRAQAAYGRVSERAHQTAERVEPFVHERPYASLGIAASVGLILGMLLAKPKVIYVRPPSH